MYLAFKEKLCLSLEPADSDSDNFQSLKASKSKQNGSNKKSEEDSCSPKAKERVKSPAKPPLSRGKTEIKSPKVPTTPKLAPPPPPKQTPTSVLDYFGSGEIHRSDKKLVASTKRKAVSQLSCPRILHDVFSNDFLTLQETKFVKLLSSFSRLKS